MVLTTIPVTVYFDGQCPICARKIAHYRRWGQSEWVSFVDIAAPNFDAVHHGVDPALARQILHVKIGAEMRTGIDAAIAMWQAIPAYRWLAWVVWLPGVYCLARICYRIFARFRPYLQRRLRPNCVTGICRNP